MNNFISQAGSAVNVIMGWPIIFFVIGVSIIVTLALGFIQLRYFFAAWKYTFAPSKSEGKSDMSPFQAFINTLNTSTGNGSIAGMATAIYSGGPGAAFWIIIITLLLMSVRYAEVYLSTFYGERAPKNNTLGGPMLYLRNVIGGKYLAYAYAVACVFFGFTGGSAMQANSMSLSIYTAWQVPLIVTGFIIFAFVFYAILGGAARIVKFSEAIVPLKVGVFFLSSIIVLLYHYQAIIPALKLIVGSALNIRAFAGGVLGFSIQQSMRYGIIRSINATESGLGIAAIMFGSTGSKNPVKDGIMSMATTLVSALVCFIVALCIIASGVWNSGATSTALTMAAYSTVFGTFGGWIISFLSFTFGIGVIVSYAYITKAAWDAVLGNRLTYLFIAVYSLSAFLGAQMDVTRLWSLIDISLACMLVINLIGVLYLLPQLKRGLQSFKNLAE